MVYFFPAAFTQGCTIETKAFADKADEFKAAGATLIGLTAGAAMADGTMASAKDNLAAPRRILERALPRQVPDRRRHADTVKAYDVVLRSSPDWSNRTSYVIAPDGKVLLSHTDMKPDEPHREDARGRESLEGCAPLG